MNNTSGIYIHSQTALSKTASVAIQEGSSVFVKVIGKTAANTYTMSFAGGKFSVKSSTQFLVGDSFLARIKIQNGKIALVLQNENIGGKENFSLSKTITNLQSPEAVAYFASLGLTPDEITKKLLQQTMQLGLSIKPFIINKARTLSQAFPGRETEAAELALILEEKGISADIKILKKMLGILASDNDVQNKSKSEIRKSKSDIKDFFNSIMDGSFFENGEKKYGLLTVFNQYKKKNFENTGGHWFLLPFSFNLENGGKTSKGDGVIRLFAIPFSKRCEKIVINLKIGSKNLEFAIKFDKLKNVDIKYCVPEVFSSFACAELETQFKNIFASRKSVSIAKVESTDLDSFATEDIPLSILEKMV